MLTDWARIGVVLLRLAASIVTLPLIAFTVLRLTADKRVMGVHANGWFTNLVLVLTTLSAIHLGYRGMGSLLHSGK